MTGASAANPRLLSPLDKVRFRPDATFTGVARLLYKAWDGAATSTAVETATLTVNATDDRPVFTGTPVLSPVMTNDTSHTGDLVAALLGGTVIDADANAQLGIAITNAVSKTGTWEYSTDGGITWQAVLANGTVNARTPKFLLGTDRIRYTPNTGFIGTAKLSFKAWDSASLDPNGPNAVSVAIKTVSVVVNTAPTL
jgi:hypothetical protein